MRSAPPLIRRKGDSGRTGQLVKLHRTGGCHTGQKNGEGFSCCIGDSAELLDHPAVTRLVTMGKDACQVFENPVCRAIVWEGSDGAWFSW